MIAATGLSKRYGDRVAVDDVSFVVEPGVVTGFLGPNGAGKSTTMRLILGLDAPTAGAVTVNARCSRRGRSTLAAPPTTTCSRWRRRTVLAAPGWTR